MNEAKTNPPIAVFDLRYTLHYDREDRAQISMVWDHCHAASALQGIVNRAGPNLFILYSTYEEGVGPSLEHQTVPDANIDLYWFEKYRQPGEWLSGRPVVQCGGIVELVEKYRSFIRGAVVYDSEVPATCNVASTAAGVEDLVPVRYDPSADSLYEKLILNGPKLPVRLWLLEPDGRSKFTGSGEIPDIGRASTGSAKCDAYLWMKHKYMDTGRCNDLFGEYSLDFGMAGDPESYLGAHYPFGPRSNLGFDIFTSRRGFFFDLSPWQDEPATDDPAQAPGTDFNTLCELLLSAYEHGGRENMIHIVGFPPIGHKYNSYMSQAGPEATRGKHGGVETEWEAVRVLSAYNAFLDTGGYTSNASFWTHFPLEEQYPQRWVTHEELRENGYLTERGEVNLDGRKFVMMYVGDYDSADWLSQFMPSFWDHPDRGTIPLAWSISPVLDVRAPMAMHYLWKTATPMDFFLAANNGAGYLNPSMLAEPRPISGLPGGVDAWQRQCAEPYRRWGLTVTGFVIEGYAPPLNEEVLDCYASFSPNGIVPMKSPLTLLHRDMPVLRAGMIVLVGTPEEVVAALLKAVEASPIPFFWARTMLQSPGWYRRVHEMTAAANPKVELLDAPTFFELYRIYLQTNPDAAEGRLEIPEDLAGRDWGPGDVLP